MGDFLTRLSERTLGTVPVVQPMIAPVFAREPVNLERDSEVTGDWSPSVRETQPTPNASAGRREDQGTVGYTMPTRHRETPDTRSDPHRRGASRSSEREVAFRHEDERDPAPVESPQSTPEPESSHLSNSDHSERRTISGKEDRREPSPAATRHPEAPTELLRHADPALPGVISTSQDVLPESSPIGPSSAADESDEAEFQPVRVLVDRIETPTPRPLPETWASSDARGSRVAPDPREPSDVPRLITPRVVRPRFEDFPEQGSRESRGAAPESPTIRVAIGRIEVRAVTPPSARPPTPARTGPSLSLDDYLKQRNGGQQ
jgi:hypothetical protein